MPLFAENRVRSAIVATAAVGIGHLVTRFLVSPLSSPLVQALVAIVAIAALVFLVIMHHRQEGQLLTQPQEEAALIGGLALSWIVIVVAWRAMSGSGDSTFGYPGHSEGTYKKGSYGGWGCPPGDPYCHGAAHIVEEYVW